MKKLILTLLIVFSSLASPAQSVEVDEQTKKICNDVILNIYNDILENKDKYEELVDFGENAFFKNEKGFYAIIYEYKGPKQKIDKSQDPYEIGVTIDGMKEQPFSKHRGAFDFGFPVFNIKITGYQRKHLLRTQFDILPLIQKHGSLLNDHQQNYIPLRLYLKPVKDTFYTREDIEFEVILKNVSKRHMRVKALSKETLYFLFNNEFWGTQPKSGARGGKEVILKSGEELRLYLKGESFQRPQEIEIYGAYRMSVKGINPTNKLKLKVINPKSFMGK